MNYKKLIRKAVHVQQDSSLSIFAFLTGLAAGAAIAILFAPRSGREARKLAAEKLATTQQQKHPQELEEQLFDDLRETTRDHAEKLPGPENKRKDPTQIKVPSAGTNAWRKQVINK